MANFVLSLLALLARAVASMFTHPAIWLLALGWIAISKFNFGVFTREVRHSVAELWWLVLLILVTALCNTAIKAYFLSRRQ